MTSVPKSVDGLSRHDERARKAFVRQAQWRALLRKVELRDGRRCRVCRRPCRFGAHQVKYYGDPHHVVPRALGGDDTLDNIATLCRSCHDERHVHGRLHLTGNASQRDALGHLNGLTVERRINGEWRDVGVC